MQLWLLSQGRCVGCGKDIVSVSSKVKKGNTIDQLTCECRRVYMYDTKKKTFRRALITELS